VFDPETGEVDQKYVRNPWGNGLHPTNVRYEPAVYAVTPRAVTQDSTCIAMTRALGDFYAHQFGLTAVPTIKTVLLDPDQDYEIVIGSDGIWDCWRYSDFANFVQLAVNKEGLSAEDLCDKVLDESIVRAKKNFGVKHFDDASFVCWRISPTKSATA
jgi:serine/threonine protein phosphatase PrpC